jgi:glyoxylase-like metal-dependent hydrolase (beta-lactamase superfamily II)
MKIIPLSEGSFTVDGTKAFVPFDTGIDSMKERPAGSLLVEIQPFVIQTAADIILIDTGLGYDLPDGQFQLYANLEKAGIRPEQITKVLISHLHKDHAGGISRLVNGERFLSFPYATWYLQKREFDYAMETKSGSYRQNDFSLLADFSKLVWLDADEGSIGDTIRYRLTGAHSKFHQVFWVEDNGTRAFFGGDVAPQLMQMKNRFIAKYDYDGKKCMELRQQWWKEGGEQHWHFLFYHDIKSPVWQSPE